MFVSRLMLLLPMLLLLLLLLLFLTGTQSSSYRAYHGQPKPSGAAAAAQAEPVLPAIRQAHHHAVQARLQLKQGSTRGCGSAYVTAITSCSSSCSTPAHE
jgi:hypothetical protein